MVIVLLVIAIGMVVFDRFIARYTNPPSAAVIPVQQAQGDGTVLAHWQGKDTGEPLTREQLDTVDERILLFRGQSQ